MNRLALPVCALLAPPPQLAPAPRQVVFSPRPGAGAVLGHDQLTKLAVARHLAELLDAPFLGVLPADRQAPAGASLLVVPSETLLAGEPAWRLGVRGPDDLFGGVVPHAFVATKVITHPLVQPDAAAPAGWCAAFPAAVAGVVLPGYSVFSVADALEAGRRLAAGGSLRLKAPHGVGGRGQAVVRSLPELQAWLAGMDAAQLREDGLVIERNLRDVATYSVGQVRLGPWLASYCGTQGLTTNHAGESVYGGSQLTVVRGDYDALLAQPLPAAQRSAVAQALVYHRQALACFDGLVATRCNYDVAQGRDDAGRPCGGVLEQSWRIGGASGAEAVALHALRRDAALQVVDASTHEVYGEPGELPAGAKVYYDGIDPEAGRLVKYAVVRRHGHA